MVDVQHFNSGAQSVLAYATVNGGLVGWDLRCNSNAWTLRHDLRLGLITSFSVDMHQCWLCLGVFQLYTYTSVTWYFNVITPEYLDIFQTIHETT